MLHWNARYRRFDSRPWPVRKRPIVYPSLLALASIYNCSRDRAQQLAYQEVTR